MTYKEFKNKLLKRYLNNQASAEEMEVFFQLLKEGELDNQLKFQLEQEANKREYNFSFEAKQNNTFLSRCMNSAMFRIAAMLVVVLSVSLILYSKRANIKDYVDPVVYSQSVVPKGQTCRLTLADGTKVWLNSASVLRFPEKFNRDKREVYLEGEAFFEVAHNKKKPFIIYSGSIKTTVVGTSFYVKAYKNESAVVTVKTGIVKVTEALGNGESKTIMLTATQQAVCNKKSGLLKKEHIVARDLEGWKEGDLIFTGRTIEEMVPILERWYNVSVQLKGDKLAQSSMVGSYHKESLENVLKAMSFSLNMNYSIDKNQVTITEKNNENLKNDCPKSSNL